MKIAVSRTLAADLAAGVTVAAMLVPQAMAYALLAGLPPQVGLYASTVPLVVYALLGTSRQLAVGPVAIVSLLTASSLAAVAEEGSAGYVAAAGVLALLVAAVHFVLAAGRLGFLVRLLSHPVLVGFTAAAAIIIGTSQVKQVLGTSPEGGEVWISSVAALLASVPDTHLLTLVVGLGSLALMVVLRRISRAIPAALVAVVVTTTASVLLDLSERGVRVVGDIPSGLPPLTLPSGLGLAVDLIPAALAITMVGFLESVAVAKIYARRNSYDIDANRELYGLGAANLASGLFGGYPVTGGFSRTAVNASAGAKSKWAAVITAGLILLVLIALTPLFTELPQATLGAVVLLAVASLLDVAEMRHIAHVKRADAVTMGAAFVATLVLGVELGIAVSAVTSMVVVFIRMMRPHTAVLGRLPGTATYRNVDRFPEAEVVPGVVIVRFDVSLSYLNVEFMKSRIRELVDATDGAHALVLNMEGVNDIDTAAIETLQEMVEELADRGVVVHLAALKGPVRDVLARTSLAGEVAGVHLEVDHAVQALALQAAAPVPAHSAHSAR